jgi:uncharacterized protein (DUF2147 family)
MRRATLGLMGMIWLALPVQTFAATPEIDGVWSREDGAARVRIAACGEKLCATNIWVKPGDSDEKVGDVLEMKLRQGDGGGLTGEAYDKRRDLHYSMDITVNGTAMTTKGCVVGGLICKSSEWTRGG